MFPFLVEQIFKSLVVTTGCFSQAIALALNRALIPLIVAPKKR